MKKIFSSATVFALFLVLSLTSVGTLNAQVMTPLTCSPASQAVQVGQQVNFIAQGGNGIYTWTLPGITTTYSGPTLTLSYPLPGSSTVTLQSGGQTVVCSVTIGGGVSMGGTTGGAYTPGLPNTGEGGDAPLNITLLLSGLWVVSGGAVLALYFRKRTKNSFNQ